MDRGVIKQALYTINKRGWNLYRRSIVREADYTIKLGPVEGVYEVDEWSIFNLFPRVSDPKDPEQIKKFNLLHEIGEPTIKVPRVPYAFARARFDEGDTEEYGIPAGEEVQFQGISFEGAFVRLIARTRTFMTPEAFLAALGTLQDLTLLAEARAEEAAKKTEATLKKAVPRDDTTFTPLSRGRFRCNQTGEVVKQGRTMACRRARANLLRRA